MYLNRANYYERNVETDMYSIRNFNSKDTEYLKKICIETAKDIFRGKKITERALVDVYCRYYIEQEPENCFVVVDERDRAKGYIMCAQNYDSYKKIFKENYLKTWNPVTLIMGNFALKSIRDYVKEYPSHLHIDLLPECQGQGYGSKLVESLIVHLREKKINGLMLHVSVDNDRAISFYKKCGFKVLYAEKDDVLMGIRIT